MNKILVIDDDRAIRLLLCELMKTAGHSVESAKDGLEGLEKLRKKKYDLILLDVWMPRMNGLEFLSQLRKEPSPPPKVIVMTADNTPETLLSAVKEQVYMYMAKPFQPKALEEMVKSALSAKLGSGAIEVISARPDWVELLVPCELETAERIQSFMNHLDIGLAAEVREAVGRAFHELLLNAIEWGGELDPNRKVRISYLRARRMLLYCIKDPGKGFRLEDLPHAAVSNPPGQPFDHIKVRDEKGLRAGGFGILMTRAMVDELLYNEERNEVVFVKYLD
ncbi:MAG TPA: response regulator [Terriglobia bacterium]|nr:response regulator [Terriglobia bacterium]